MQRNDKELADDSIPQVDVYSAKKYCHSLWIQRLDKNTSEDVKNKVAILTDIIQEKFKNSKILISIPLYRLGNEPFNRKTQKFGSLVKEMCIEKKVTFMFHNNINKVSDNVREDGVHLSTKGTALMVAISRKLT